MRRRIVAGNWKLHGTRAFATALVGELAAAAPVPGVELVVLPPLPYLGDLIEDFEGTALGFGAQDVSSNEQGAYTGEVSASMLVDGGAAKGVRLADGRVIRSKMVIATCDPRTAMALTTPGVPPSCRVSSS